MATKTDNRVNPKRTIVMDRDGVIIDDVTKEFDRRFRKGNSLPERALKELVFVSLNLMPLGKKNLLDGHDDIDGEAVEYMRRMQRKGDAIVVKTTNRRLNLDKEASRLAKEGIDAKVEHAGMLNKLDRKNENEDEKKLNEDNQLAAFVALIKTGGSEKKITLVKRDYNTLSGLFIKLFGKHSRLNYSDMEKLED